VVLDLFGTLNAIIVIASDRALRRNGADLAAHAPAEFEQEASTLSAELETVVQLAAEAARTLSGADEAVVEVTTLSGKVHWADARGGQADRARGTLDGLRHPWPVAAVSTLEISPGLATDESTVRTAGRRPGVPSVITVPLHSSGVSLGSVTVTSTRPRAFSTVQAAALEHLGAQVGSAALRLHMLGEMLRIDQQGKGVLETSEALFRRLFYENPVPMWVVDSETDRFLAVNDAACAHYGYSREEFAEMTVATVRRDAAQWAVDLRNARLRRPPPGRRTSRAVPRSSRSSLT
jgi:GAF domain-containing protein